MSDTKRRVQSLAKEPDFKALDFETKTEVIAATNLPYCKDGTKYHRNWTATKLKDGRFEHECQDCGHRAIMSENATRFLSEYMQWQTSQTAGNA